MKKEKEKKEVKKVVERYTITVIGSGGTGTFFLKEFTHFLARNQKAQECIHRLVIADGDVVEEKNLDRQCFVREDVGMNKAALFADILNGAMQQYGVSDSFKAKWEAYPNYVTSKDTLKELMRDKDSSTYSLGGTSYSSYKETLTLNIPIIIGCVDNNAARLMMEEVFNVTDNCFLYDAGNEFQTGEVNYAHRLNGKTISYEKSRSFPGMLSGDKRHVTEMSCTELNVSAPQHFITNMTAGYHLLRGMVNLFSDMDKSISERIKNQLGYVFFDSFSGLTDYTQRICKEQDV